MADPQTKKKIAIVSDAVYPFNKGGKEKRIYDISTRLAAQGHDVTIYCMRWWEGETTFVKDGVKFYAISPYYPVYVDKRRSIKQAILFSLHCLKLMGEEFDIIDVDHIPQLTLFTAKFVCLLRRKKMIATWHEVWGQAYWEKYLGKPAGTIAYRIEKISAKLPNVIISVSDHTTYDLQRILETKRKIVTVPNGLDVKSIRSIAPSKITSDIIFAGRLLSHKNVDLLLRAIKILKKENDGIRAIIVGEGPEKENLEKLASDLYLENNVAFMDFFEDHNDLYALMHASKVFALPSTREGFGIMVIEADACGLPVVTIDHPQNAAKALIQKNGNGELSEFNEKDFANAINSALAKRKSPEAYVRYAEKYDWSHIIPELMQVYGPDLIYKYPLKEVVPEQNLFKGTVVLLTSNSIRFVKPVVEGIAKQKFDSFEVLCVDTSSTDGTREILEKYPFQIITIKPEDFGHGKTRNYAARIARGEFVIYLSHDAAPEREDWLANLVQKFTDPKVVGVYGRQIPKDEHGAIERHFQLSLYGDQPITWEGGNWTEGDNIFSDANSAVRKSAILEHAYKNEIIVSEDYEWASRMLRLGYKIVYANDATVMHSHSYTLKQLFQRNFDIGISYRSIYHNANLPAFINRGLKILTQEIKDLYNSGNAKLIPEAIFRNMIRFIAIQMGRSEWLFSKRVKRDYLSGQRWYWK